MSYPYLVLAQIFLGLSLGGIFVILARKVFFLLGLTEIPFSWKSFKKTLPQKGNLKKKIKGFLKAEKREKSHLKRDYWDKLLKK